jgi:hypothetical protein
MYSIAEVGIGAGRGIFRDAFPATNGVSKLLCLAYFEPFRVSTTVRPARRRLELCR